jgi:uncharacterized protein
MQILPQEPLNIEITPRFAEAELLEALTDSPTVLIHGPRQCGKTTLARAVGERMGYSYFTFDDDVKRSSAVADPVGFVADLPVRCILDEVQRVPSLFLALKALVDRERTPRRFILTGSSNVLLLPKLANSLAGRMSVVRLHPLAQCEIARQSPGFLDALFAGKFKAQRAERQGGRLAERIANGGYPAALVRGTARRRVAWYRDYIDALVQRDVRELARINSLDALPRLLALAAAKTARLQNVADLAAPFQLSRPTIRDYITLLERVFLVDTLPPWHSNKLGRLIKTPKLHLGDTGVACALAGIDAKALTADRTLLGQFFETFVFQELQRHASWHPEPHRFFHFRDKDGVEVDIVIERGARGVAGVEVKTGATVTDADFRGLRKLQSATATRFCGGAVIYDGESLTRFGEGLYAVPVSMLWEPGAS